MKVFRRESKANIALPSEHRILEAIAVDNRLMRLLNPPKPHGFIRRIGPSMERGRHQKGGIEAHGSMLGSGNPPVLQRKMSYFPREGQRHTP